MPSNITNNEQETKEYAAQLASTLRGGDVVLLEGNLGAGKTTFVKGLAEALGVTDQILSPTFTLMNLYVIKNLAMKELKHLVHVDTYRLKTEQELIDIGIEDYLGDRETICVIEWPEKIAGLLKNKKMVSVIIDHLEGGKRKITISS